MKVIFSDLAISSLKTITDFLRERWTDKELAILRRDISVFHQTINDGIIHHQKLDEHPNIQFTLIGKKQIKLFYEKTGDRVTIKLFWHCKQKRKLHRIFNQKVKPKLHSFSLL